MTHEWLDLILTALGATLIATLTTWWFLYRRGLEPSSELQLDVTFTEVHGDSVPIEVVALLTNKSAVRQYYKEFQISVRYLLPSDQIADGPEGLGYQLQVPHCIDDRVSAKRYFGYAEYIDSGVAFRHSYITFVPAQATTLLLHAKLLFRTRRHWYSLKYEWHRKSMQRLVSLKPPSNAPAVKDKSGDV